MTAARHGLPADALVANNVSADPLPAVAAAPPAAAGLPTMPAAAAPPRGAPVADAAVAVETDAPEPAIDETGRADRTGRRRDRDHTRGP